MSTILHIHETNGNNNNNYNHVQGNAYTSTPILI